MEMKTDGFLRNVPLRESSLSEELCHFLSEIGVNDLEDLSMLKETDFHLLPFMNERYIQELKEVVPSSFSDSYRPDEEILRHISLAMTDISIRSRIILSKSEIFSCYDLVKNETLFSKPVDGLGSKSLAEVKNLIHRLKEEKGFPDLITRFFSPGCIYLQDGNIELKGSLLFVSDITLKNIITDSSLLHFTKKHGFADLSDVLLFSMEGFASLKRMNDVKYQKAREDITDYIRKNIKMRHSPEKQAYLKKIDDILLLIEKEPCKGVFREELYRNEEKEEADAILEFLLRDGKIDITMEGKIIRHYPSVGEVVKRHSHERYTYMVEERLQGKSLEEISRKEGDTRERVRQRIVRFLIDHCKNSLYFEDRFRYLYTTYSTDEKSFTDITGCDMSTYIYLFLRYRKGEKSLEKSFYDKNLLLEIRERIALCGYADIIRIEGKLVKKNRSSLFDFYISHHLTEPKRIEEIHREYRNIASKYGKSFTYPNIHSLEMELVSHPYTIFLGHHCFRYYDYSSYDYQDLLNDISLESYHDTFFSSEYFFRRNPFLMKEYDIRDKNELFSLLKRLYCKNQDIHFIDMPYIVIGHFDRKEYLLGILKEYGELSTKDFAKILDERLGISNQGALWLTDIREYMMKRGVFIYDIGHENHSDLTEALKGKLTEDFYFKKELSNIIKGVDIESIPHAVYMKFGYVSYSSYILKSTYDAKSYFSHILSKDDVIS